MAREVPLRRSVLVKLLVLSALVSGCSIAATAWLTVHTTAVAIRQAQGQALAGDAMVYRTLLGYAATHHDWADAGPVVRGLAERSGHRITLTDRSRHLLVASDSGGRGATTPSLPAQVSATIDPLDVDQALAARPGAGAGPGVSCDPLRTKRCVIAVAPDSPTAETIDPRAVGPFQLTGKEETRQRAEAEKVQACLRADGTDAGLSRTASGRFFVQDPQVGLDKPLVCGLDGLNQPLPTSTEKKALGQLNTLVGDCLGSRRSPGIPARFDLVWEKPPTSSNAAQLSRIASCVESSRKQQLAPYVAAPALLFLGDPRPAVSTFLDFSPANRTRIIGVTALVLLVTLTVTTVAGIRMIRPLRALVAAANRMTGGDLSARVRVRTNDEIGGVATAFNTMSEHRQRSEGLRKVMVSDVAHELRTPLSNIRGWLEAAEDGIAVPDEALLSSLLGEAILLQHVIDDLRDLSAADAGELRLLREFVDIVDLLDQVVTAHRGYAETSGVRLVLAENSTPEAVADPVRIRQAVGNLVSNAVRHTPAGGQVTLTAGTEAGQVVIEVADTGEGIPPGDLPRLFDRFWRAEKSRSRRTGGSGLGLSIARKIAEAHGGTITVRSTLGAGSVFTLRVPVVPPSP